METLRGIPLKKKPFNIIEDLLYLTDELPCSNSILVKAPFRTDFASIPRFFWRICGAPSDWYREAAVIHDYLCPRFDAQGIKVPHLCDHETAADVFYEGMLDIIENSKWCERTKARRKWQAKVMRWGVIKYGPKFESDSWGGGA